MDWKILLAYAAGVLIILLIAKMSFAPVKVLIKLALNCLAGGVLIFILNFIGSAFGIEMPLNIVTAFFIGVLGIPGFLLNVLIIFLL